MLEVGNKVFLLQMIGDFDITVTIGVATDLSKARKVFRNYFEKNETQVKEVITKDSPLAFKEIHSFEFFEDYRYFVEEIKINTIK